MRQFWKQLLRKKCLFYKPVTNIRCAQLMQEATNLVHFIPHVDLLSLTSGCWLQLSQWFRAPDRVRHKVNLFHGWLSTPSCRAGNREWQHWAFLSPQRTTGWKSFWGCSTLQGCRFRRPPRASPPLLARCAWHLWKASLMRNGTKFGHKIGVL